MLRSESYVVNKIQSIEGVSLLNVEGSDECAEVVVLAPHLGVFEIEFPTIN